MRRRKRLSDDVICTSPSIVLFVFSKIMIFGFEVVIEISLALTVIPSAVRYAEKD